MFRSTARSCRPGRCMNATGNRGLVAFARCTQPGRLPTRVTCSAAASIPLFLGSRTHAPARQQSPEPETSGSQKLASKQPISAHESPSGAVATGSQHHHVSRVRPFVLGSPPGLLGGSHTQPANCGIAAHGCYRVIGPARISKRGDCLVARLLPGARLELLSAGGGCTTAVEVVEHPPHPHRHHHNHHQHRNHNQSTDERLPSRDGSVSVDGLTVLDAAAAGRHAWDPVDGVECACTGPSGSFDEGEEEEGGEPCDVDGEVLGEEEDGAVTECVLVASYVELGGSASSMDVADISLQPAMHHHHGRTYLSVRNLPCSAVIDLGPDGDLSHPVNVTPGEPVAHRSG